MDTRENSRADLNRTILLVDDDRNFLEAMEEKFKSNGFTVIKAADGLAGLASALSQKPALIVLDILMPKMDGINMLRELRADRWGRNVPVIFLTNINENKKLAEALEIGIDDYLIKTDVQLDVIIERAKKLSSFTFQPDVI